MSKPIGYKNPPEHGRFKKGQSGNPSGRPKRPPKVEDDVLAELAETLTINEAGKPRRITKQRALIKGHTARAIKGDPRSARLILDLLARAVAGDAEGETEGQLTSAEQQILEDYLEAQVELRLAQRKEIKS
jgi:hypothetical protein